MHEETQTLDAILREDFAAFVEKVFETVSPADAFRPNWHVEAIAHALSQCRTGETRRLIITQPPRSLKSVCASIAFPAWVMGHDPTARFLCVSYAQELSLDLARKFRLVVESAWYQRVFPRLRLGKRTEAECETTAGGTRIAASVGGTITGRGADYIVIDDPLKASDGSSEAARRQAVDWYSTTLVSRLNDKTKGVTILVMQRLHAEDLVGHLLETDGGRWRHLDLPAIAEEDQTVETGRGRVHHRRRGDLLHPEREPRGELDSLKASLGSLVFSAQYQQRPIPADGNLVKREWLKTYDQAPDLKQTGWLIVQSWDTAGTDSAASDYSVCVTAAVHYGRDYYILDVNRDRLSYPDLKKRIIALAARHKPVAVLFERAGTGHSLYQEFGREHHPGLSNVIAPRPQGDKELRLTMATPALEAGHVFLPKEAPWLAAFLEEVLGFPNARHDDQVDALSQLINWHRKNYRPTLSASAVVDCEFLYPQVFDLSEDGFDYDVPY